MIIEPAERRRAFIPTAVLYADALAYPVNGLRDGHITQLLGRVTAILEADANVQPEKPERYRRPGLHSCVGQRFLAVLAGTQGDPHGRTPPGAAVGRMLELCGASDAADDFGAWRIPGRPLQRALLRWRTEFPWDGDDCHTTDATSAGSGPAIDGLAIVAAGRGAADDLALGIPRLTHLAPLALSAAYAMARAAELLLASDAGRRVDGAALAATLEADVRAHEEGIRRGPLAKLWRKAGIEPPEGRLADALAPLPTLLREGRDDLAQATLLRDLERFAPDCAVTHLTHGFAPVLVPWVLYRALGPLSAPAAIEDMVARGGDACLATALLAGLLACRYGAEHFATDGIERLAVADVARVCASTGSPDWADAWVQQEHAWSGEESATRAALVKKRDRAEGNRPAPPKPKPRPASPEPAPQKSPVTPQMAAAERWARVDDEQDPEKKKQLKEARARKRVDWKEERRRDTRRHEDE